MAKLTLSIQKELKEKLDKIPEVNWSEIIRESIRRKVEQLERFNRLVNKGVI